jgi:hypothetical protein
MQGTYKPTSGSDPAAAFQLKSGVTIYGGFAGTETARAQRQSSLYNATILSGDIGAVGDKSDNSYHVVIGASNAILDGFTITAGNAYGIDAYSNGGGMYNYNTSNLTVTNITFSGNSANNGGGGGMYNYNNSSLTVTNVTFSDNSADMGGGMYNEGNSPRITNAIFSNNSARWEGGGMFNKSANPIVTNVTFNGNSAGFDGGGMFNYYYSSPQVTTATFSDNSAKSGGGMYNVTESNPIIANATFSSNSATTNGGGVFNESNPTLINVTFSGNSADQGGGIYNFFYGSPVLKNVLIANSSGGDCALEYRALNSASANNLIEDSSSACGLSNGDGKGSIVGVAPLLGTLGNYGGSTQTIPLLPGSPAINAGNDAFCAVTSVNNLDQRGVARPFGTHCDIGAFEANFFTLNYMVGNHGFLTGNSPQGVATGASGTEVTAVPDTGYHFVSWSDGVLTASRTDTNVTDDITVTANFAINTYTLTYTAGANGSISGTSPQTVNHGADGSQVTAVPDTGYHFVSWSDGVLTASRTDTNVTDDITVTANFAINTYTLTYTAGANGSISGTSPQTVNHGADGSQVTAVPDTGYHFVSWGDGVLTASRTDTNVTDDINVSANFALSNQPPTDISISVTSLNENLPIGATVGTLSTFDSDAGDAFVYSFCGGADDASFSIAGASLQTAAVFDYETKNSYAICVRTTDSGGLTFDKNFTITVTNVIETVTATIRSTGAQDGWVLESGENTNVGKTMDASATTLRLGDDAAKKQYRSVLSFATGVALPDNAVITKVTLKVKRQAIVGGGNPVATFQGFMVDIRKGILGTSALQTTDWKAAPNKTYGPFNTALVSGWYSIDLTAGKTYVNKLATLSGLTQIRLRFQLDDNNNAIANYLSLFSGDAPTASRPQLIIEYRLP